MYESDSSLLSFDQDIEDIIKKGDYGWEEFKYLLSLFLDAQSQDYQKENINQLKPPLAIQSIKDRFDGFKPLVACHFNAISLIGYSFRKTIKEKLMPEIYDSGILWNKHYYFILNTKFEIFGINRYEFELGQLDHSKHITIVLSRIVFQGPDGLSEYPRIYLAMNEKGVLKEK